MALRTLDEGDSTDEIDEAFGAELGYQPWLEDTENPENEEKILNPQSLHDFTTAMLAQYEIDIVKTHRANKLRRAQAEVVNNPDNEVVIT